MHHLLGIDIRIFHVCLDTLDHFTEIVRRNRCSHTDRDTFCAVDENIRHLDRKYLRLLLGLIKVRYKVHDIFIEVCQICFLCDLMQSRLRITHRSGAVALDRSEIAMSVDERQTFLEILRHHNERIVDRTVSVRVIFTHRITDDTRTLSVRSVIADTQLIHIIEGTPLYRL